MSKPHITVSKGVLNATDGQQVTDRVVNMLDVAMQAPLLHSPRGMSLHPAIKVDAPPEHAAKHHPVVVRTFILARPIDLEDKHSVQDKKTGAWNGTGEGPALHLDLNDLGAFLSNSSLNLSTPDNFFSEPRKIGQIQGFPVYDAGGNEILLISKRDILPWQPVPVERYVQMLISQEEQNFASVQKMQAGANSSERALLEKTNAKNLARLEALKQELAQLSPAQRAAGACRSARNRRDNPTGLDLTCASGSDPLVMINQDVFSRSAPRSSLQFLTITTTWGVFQKDDRMPNALGRVLRAALEEIDLKALQATLD